MKRKEKLKNEYFFETQINSLFLYSADQELHNILKTLKSLFYHPTKKDWRELEFHY